ncbi:hypothetical protein HAX54_019612, partial [Datura stramonium]|nr:hypothetical protein [Datura stramonium]
DGDLPNRTTERLTHAKERDRGPARFSGLWSGGSDGFKREKGLVLYGSRGGRSPRDDLREERQEEAREGGAGRRWSAPLVERDGTSHCLVEVKMVIDFLGIARNGAGQVYLGLGQ